MNSYGQKYDVPAHVGRFNDYYNKAAEWFGPSEAQAATNEELAASLLGGGLAGSSTIGQQKPKTDTIQSPTGSQIMSEQFPEPIASSHAPADFQTRTKAAFVDDPKTMIRIFAAARFPTLTPEQAEARYWMQDGKFYYRDNDSQVYQENGEGLGDTLKRFAAQVVGKSPSIVGGGAGFVAGGIPGMMAGTAAGEAFRQGVGSQLGEEKTWPDVAKEIAKETVGAAAGLGIGKVAEPFMNALGRAGTGRIGRLAATDYRSLNPIETQRLMALGERYGIPLTLPEATGSPSLVNAFNFASTSPYEVSERIMQWAETQRVPQIKEAIQRELNAIFPNESIFEAGRMGQQAASEGLGVLKQSRKAMADPYYTAARESGAKVDITPVLEKVDELQAMAPRGWKVDTLLSKIRKGLTREQEVLADSQMPGKQEMQGIIRDAYANIDAIRKVGISTDSIRADYNGAGVKAINRALPALVRKSGRPLDEVAADYGFESADALFGALVDYQPRYKLLAQAEKEKLSKQIVPVDDIRVLHGAKIEIDSLLKGPEAEGLSNDIKRQLMQIKETLIDQMEAASPEYARGMEKFREGSKLVNDFLYGQEQINPSNKPPLSTLGRIAQKKQGEAVEDIPGMLFGKQSSPAVVAQAKKYIEGQNSEAWKALVRAHLQDRLETAVKDSQGWGAGYKFKETVFGTPRQQMILREAMIDPITGDSSTYRRFADFMDLLDVTNRIVYRNSRTTPLAVTKELIEREAGGVHGRIIELAGSRINWSKWAEINRRLATPEYLNRVYDAMMDPGTATSLAKIRQLSSPQKQAIETISLMGGLVGENVIDDSLGKQTLYSERSAGPSRAGR